MVLTSGFTLGLPGVTPPSFSYLLVGGGGSGSSANNLGGGGGGAGGFVTNTITGVSTSSEYTITVGSGGAGVNATPGGGNNGVSSTLTNSAQQYSYGFINTSPPNYVATASSSTFNLSLGDWTIEGWFNNTTSSGSSRYITFYPASGSPVYGLIGGAGNTFAINTFGSSNVLTSSVSTVLNVWAHVALVSYGGTITLYINGVSTGTSSNSWCPNQNTQLEFGGQAAGQNFAYWYEGYISNIRIVMGTAVYTGAFTPPALAPLATSGSASAACYASTTNVNITFAATDTKFLTAQSSTLVDNSLTNYIVGVTTPTNSISPIGVTAIGGGTGGYYSPYTNASAGGSGGGAAWNGSNLTTYGIGLQPSSVSGGLGNNGGAGGASNSGGGGGGAGAVGGNSPNANDGGAGGAGYSSSISGSSVVYAAGGGGGASYGTGGTGGSGIGGNGGTYGGAAATAGATNTGSGGGAAAYTGTYGGNGGSGVAIIRYADSYAAASATTGSPTITVTGGYRIYTWTSSGSITF